MPAPRQFLMLALLWALVGWGTGALWAMRAADVALGAALGHYYAIRAPLVGALAGVLWAPVLCRGSLPGRASALAGRAAGLAVESRTRRIFRVVQGAVVGQLVGVSMTVVLLLLWPNEMQNTRWDAFKWAYVFWKLYWWLFVPAGAVAGMVSVAVARRWRHPPKPRPTFE
jgi:hypothetical protein